jgi:hypothetical protein
MSARSARPASPAKIKHLTIDLHTIGASVITVSLADIATSRVAHGNTEPDALHPV